MDRIWSRVVSVFENFPRVLLCYVYGSKQGGYDVGRFVRGVDILPGSSTQNRPIRGGPRDCV